MQARHLIAGLLSIGLVLVRSDNSVGQTEPKIPLLDSIAACRPAESATDCIAKDALAEAAMPLLWASAPQDRRAACTIYVLIGRPHG